MCSVGNQFANGGGFQLLRDIRALGPENGGSVPVIAMTAFAQISDPESTTPRGFRSIGASRLLRTSY
jgi:CheY-like chemotaxis protein